jgi:hypothetical protein
LNDLRQQFAIKHRVNPLVEFEKFRDYWIAQPGQKGVKLDWDATWRNWCRNAKTGPVEVGGSQPIYRHQEVKQTPEAVNQGLEGLKEARRRMMEGKLK